MGIDAALGLLALWGASWLLTTIQVRHYRQFMNQLQETFHEGYLTSGIVRGTFRRGCVVIVAIDRSGEIVSAYCMEGRTSLARFQPYVDPIGCMFTEFVESRVLPGVKGKALVNACSLLEERLIRGVLEPTPSAG